LIWAPCSLPGFASGLDWAFATTLAAAIKQTLALRRVFRLVRSSRGLIILSLFPFHESN
jgi:hypothetical protein